MPPISDLCTSWKKTLILTTLGKCPEEERQIMGLGPTGPLRKPT